ncbi:MAG: DUF1801 domain-containing protein [Ignavibacteriae bacterium]|nr:DUF1801 domain-containing protein [Ignavibacteriota bacterium]
MQSKSKTVKEYINDIPPERAEAFSKLRNTIIKNLPKGFEEGLYYGMIGYCVPHSIYPKGYHCKPEQPLPFANIASQKNFIAFYHMGLYANPDLFNWFVTEFPKHTDAKLDMGKSCVRFKKTSDIPFKLIGELMKKISVKDWIQLYEKSFLKSKK